MTPFAEGVEDGAVLGEQSVAHSIEALGGIGLGVVVVWWAEIGGRCAWVIVNETLLWRLGGKSYKFRSRYRHDFPERRTSIHPLDFQGHSNCHISDNQCPIPPMLQHQHFHSREKQDTWHKSRMG